MGLAKRYPQRATFIKCVNLISTGRLRHAKVIQDWTQLGSKITETKIALNAAEKEVFDILRLEVCHHVAVGLDRDSFLFLGDRVLRCASQECAHH